MKLNDNKMRNWLFKFYRQYRLVIKNMGDSIRVHSQSSKLLKFVIVGHKDIGQNVITDRLRLKTGNGPWLPISGCRGEILPRRP